MISSQEHIANALNDEHYSGLLMKEVRSTITELALRSDELAGAIVALGRKYLDQYALCTAYKHQS